MRDKYVYFPVLLLYITISRYLISTLLTRRTTLFEMYFMNMFKGIGSWFNSRRRASLRVIAPQLLIFHLIMKHKQLRRSGERLEEFAHFFTIHSV